MIEYYKELLFFVKKNVSNKDFANDIVQDTFAKAITFQNQKPIENKRAFLYKLARNIIIDESRKTKNIKEIPYEDNEFTVKSQEPEELVIQESRQELLMKEIKKLPEKRKEAFVLHVIEGYSRGEVAKIMNITTVAVSKHISRATLELKEKIKDKES